MQSALRRVTVLRNSLSYYGLEKIGPGSQIYVCVFSIVVVKIVHYSLQQRVCIAKCQEKRGLIVKMIYFQHSNIIFAFECAFFSIAFL